MTRLGAIPRNEGPTRLRFKHQISQTEEKGYSQYRIDEDDVLRLDCWCLLVHPEEPQLLAGVFEIHTVESPARFSTKLSFSNRIGSGALPSISIH